LEKQLAEEKAKTPKLQECFNAAAAQHRNHIMDIQKKYDEISEKNKALAVKNKGNSIPQAVSEL
jgi:hypothetical protein